VTSGVSFARLVVTNESGKIAFKKVSRLSLLNWAPR
jgi:hypothetical protein